VNPSVSHGARGSILQPRKYLCNGGVLSIFLFQTAGVWFRHQSCHHHQVLGGTRIHPDSWRGYRPLRRQYFLC